MLGLSWKFWSFPIVFCLFEFHFRFGWSTSLCEFWTPSKLFVCWYLFLDFPSSKSDFSQILLLFSINDVDVGIVVLCGSTGFTLIRIFAEDFEAKNKVFVKLAFHDGDLI